MTPYAHFERLLKESIGVDAASIGPSTIARAVRERQRACDLDDLGVYWLHLSESDAELQALVEAVVVPETWFFRDRKPFAAFGGLVRQEWTLGRATPMLRMLSVPCSTGEEPYSMAMTALDEGVPPDRFHVDAIDISAHALARARRGVYGKRAFRGQSIDVRRRHFQSVAEGHAIGDVVRRQVTFQHGNLLGPAFLPGAEVYDVIFCRNLLIYFDRAAQDRAVRVLSRLLRPDGWLFVGSSETGILHDHGFVSARIPMAFAFRRAGTEPVRSKPVAASSGGALSRRFVPPSTTTAPSGAPSRPTSAPEPPPDAGAAEGLRTGLDEATCLANQGHLVEAAMRCEQHLRDSGPSAEAFHLLGLIHDAAGNEPYAVTYYRKALYLDPRHTHALRHLALLLESLDRTSEAYVLRARARRLMGTDGVT